MSEMLERAARALCEKKIRERRRFDTDPAKLEEMIPLAVTHAWRDFVDDAAAVIAAMLDPTPDQQNRGGSVALEEIMIGRGDQRVCVGMKGAESIWRAMIAEAVKPSDLEPILGGRSGPQQASSSDLDFR